MWKKVLEKKLFKKNMWKKVLEKKFKKKHVKKSFRKKVKKKHVKKSFRKKFKKVFLCLQVIIQINTLHLQVIMYFSVTSPGNDIFYLLHVQVIIIYSVCYISKGILMNLGNTLLPRKVNENSKVCLDNNYCVC